MMMAKNTEFIQLPERALSAGENVVPRRGYESGSLPEAARQGHRAQCGTDSPGHARTSMATGGLPREFGNSLVNAIGKTVEKTRAMSPDQLVSWDEQEYKRLEGAFGKDLESKLQAAGPMVSDLEKKQPGLKNLLKNKASAIPRWSF